jgi:anti-sigma B factor antagonist
LTLKVDEDGQVVVVRPLGELDISTTPMLDAELKKAMDGGASRVTLDLSGVTFIDSTGLRLLIFATARSHGNGDRLRMLRGSAPVERMLEVTGLDHSLPFID